MDLEKAECYFEGIYKANFVAGNTEYYRIYKNRFKGVFMRNKGIVMAGDKVNHNTFTRTQASEGGAGFYF
ncbi:MAG: hypothetical protein LOD89_00260 [Tissierellales bacterium]